MEPRLCQATLAGLPPEVARPRYDRASLDTGIVHLGVGAFHRAHQAAYTEAILQTGDTRWGTAAASLRSPATRDALAAQDRLYTLEQRAQSDAYTVIGGITRLLVAPENPTALIAAMSRPEVAIVSLTVTEKAYCRDPATGELLEDDPSIRHDLTHPAAPRSPLGFLAAALARRRSEGIAPFTVLCCDNLPANGRAVRRVLTRFATLCDPDLGAYVRAEVACPNTMVDRIVPATTDADRSRVAAALGVYDAWPVVAEPFTQWVIEDRFPMGRPAWEAAGVTLVADVAPFEAMKLRLLNASHSALAYLGLLAGDETVADVMRDPGFAAFAGRLMDAAAQTLALPPGNDLAHYCRSLLDRFRNPALRHQTRQIAMDGSQKLPQRLLAPVRGLLARGQPIECHALAVAAWMRYVAGTDERGRPIQVQDPLAADLAARVAAAGPAAEALAPALLGITAIFGTDLGADDRFRTAVTTALARLTALGARRAVLEV
jgi:fructuronate reductase